MTTPQDKAYELYERYLKGYLLITDVTTARINSIDCVLAVCDSMIDEIVIFGNISVYTIMYWTTVKNEIKSIPI